MNWFESHEDEDGFVDITDIIHPITLYKLNRLKPCEVCGGNQYTVSDMSITPVERYLP